MDKTTITTRLNGPYLVRGPFSILDADGKQFKVERDTVALCRCGQSATKPFCDGTHGKVGFQAAEKAAG